MLKKVSYIVGAIAILVILSISLYSDTQKPSISTLIVPHHNLVAKQRSELFEKIADRIQHKKIILISTNHYNTGAAAIQTRGDNFSTANGEIEIDKDLLAIAIHNGAQIEPVAFETEHGIKTILPDISSYVPDAQILPLIIKENVSKDKLSKMISALQASCTDCIVVASIDSSHYQPYLHSELHDDLTRRALQNLDTTLAETKSETGEPQVVSAAIQWAKLSDTLKFVEQNHTNSTNLDKNYYAEGTTHFFGWYEQGAKTVSVDEGTFTFTGDMMFDRKIREQFNPNYYEVFTKLGDRVLWGTDLVLANLEGPITNRPTLPIDGVIPRFSFSSHVTKTIKKLHITHLALRNNHTLDAGNTGYDDTITALTASKLSYVSTTKPSVIEGNNQRLVVFNLDTTQNDSLSMKDFAPYKDINDNIIVYVHWGPEYQKEPSLGQKETAHALIDLGADMIVGVGPHVIQPAEIYKNRPIVYSLGNFLFDMTDIEATSTGLVLAGKFTKDSIVLQPMLTQQSQLQPILLRSPNANKTLYTYFEAFRQYETNSNGGIQFTISK